MGFVPGRGQGTLSFPFCAVYTSRWPRACPWAGSLGIPESLAPPAWGGPPPSLSAAITPFPRAEPHVEALGIAGVEVGSPLPTPTPAETFPSSTLVYRWGGRGPERVRSRHRVTQQHKKGLDPGGLRLARPACQISRCHGPDGCLLCNFLLLRICVFIYMFCQVPFLYYL